jgi:hypothetical protein
LEVERYADKDALDEDVKEVVGKAVKEAALE